MGIPCRPRAFRRVAWGRASVRPVEFTGRETVFVACSVQRAGRRSLWRSREEKPKRPLDLWGPEGGGRCLSERPNKRLRPPDLHVDAAADNAMLVNFNAQQASASQVHGMTNRHIGAGRAFSRPSRHPSSAPTRAAMRMFRFRKPEMRRISSSLSEKSNRRYFPRCAVPRAPAATCGRFTCKLTLPELVRLYRLTPTRPPGTPGRATTSARPRVLQPDWLPQTKRSSFRWEQAM